MDNATAFRSEEMSVLLEKWNTHPFYRAAYRASGNGIVERHHRTIESIAERGRVTPLDAVFWYNMSPRSGQDESTIPQSRCTSQWSRGRVSKVNSSNNAEVDGMPRHVLDVRRVVSAEAETELMSDDLVLSEQGQRAQRQRRFPAWARDFVM
ncbi:hypothetical protein PoB_006150300 [Plakobranchus ocellatus]|uniref:Integrase catalytic domain-containing protein n=1 Tax=Plakobranchus ocellatus TaxID=259542 RepID=A0AAV4CT21_9GAST|nr:hypothetical protein PoB_006150300 [Plakobranchus ocellatus]